MGRKVTWLKIVIKGRSVALIVERLDTTLKSAQRNKDRREKVKELELLEGRCMLS